MASTHGALDGPDTARLGARIGRRRTLLRTLADERERWALWLPVAFGTGIGAYFALGNEPPGWAGATALASALALCVAARRSLWRLIAALALAAACAGFAAAQLRTALVAAPVLERPTGPVAVRGQVLELEPRGGGLRATLRHLDIAGLEPPRTPERVRVRMARAEAELRPGDWVRLRASLRPPPGPAAPGAFDFARRAYFDRIGGVGFAFGRAARVNGPDGGSPGDAGWRLWWSGLRHEAARRILGARPGEAGAVAAALMTGSRGAIPERVLSNMRDSGLAHLLAISGLHVGLVAGLLFFGLRAGLALVQPVALRWPIKKWAAVAALLGGLGYLLLTGSTIPTQRAVLMIGLVFLAVLIDRTALTLRLVAWAAFVVLALAPESLLSASFQMSFAAVTALVAAYEALRDRLAAWRADRPLWSLALLYLAGVALTSLIAASATAPFAIYHFNRIAWYGLAANLAAVPLTALWIMPWAVVAFILMPFGLEGIALAPMTWGIDALLAVARAVAAWPGAVSIVPAMPTAGLAAAAVGGLWLCLWRRTWRLAGVPALAGGVLSLFLVTPPDILASKDGRLFGVRASGREFLLSSGRVGRFDAEIWARRAGHAAAKAWPRTGTAVGGRLRCDPLGCIYRAKGEVVALVQDPRALADDCAVATVVLSREPIRARRCRGPRVVIDRFDVWRLGAHAVWLGPDGVRVETAASRRGRRPWVPARAWWRR